MSFREDQLADEMGKLIDDMLHSGIKERESIAGDLILIIGSDLEGDADKEVSEAILSLKETVRSASGALLRLGKMQDRRLRHIKKEKEKK
jgi:hypothetical protein